MSGKRKRIRLDRNTNLEDSFFEVFHKKEEIQCVPAHLASTSQEEEILKTTKAFTKNESVLWSDEEQDLQPSKLTNQSNQELKMPVTVLTNQNEFDITMLKTDTLKFCPICSKKNTFILSSSFIMHIKSCAMSHNLSTQQLMKAIELQQKQICERNALGLPNLGAKSFVKRPTGKKGFLDTNLELGMALSASLRESEYLSKVKHTETLLEAGLEKEALSECKQLENFVFPIPSSNDAFSSSKHSNQSKRSRKTILFSRSQEERERIITEKIAILLVDSDVALEQVPATDRRTLDLKSRFLKEHVDSKSTLWKKSQYLKENIDDFREYYCKNLSTFVSPCTSSAGSKLKHLSQIPCRIPSQGATMIKDVSLCKLSINYSLQGLDTASSWDPYHADSSRSKLKIPNSASLNTFEFTKLCHAWKSLIDNRTLSDLMIYARHERLVYAHKLVLYARCPIILSEVIKETQASGKCTDILMWMDFEYETIIVFLEYLYSGELIGLKRLTEHQRNSLKELSSNYNILEVKLAIDKCDGIEPRDCSSTCNMEDSGILNKNKDVLEIELLMNELDNIEKKSNMIDETLTKVVQPIEGGKELEMERIESNTSSPIDSPEIFGSKGDSLEDKLNLPVGEDGESEGYTQTEKRESLSPLKYITKNLMLEYHSPPTPPNRVGQLSLGKKYEFYKNSIKTNKEIPLVDLCNSSNQIDCVVSDETSRSPYISPVWEGFENMNYGCFEDDYPIRIEPQCAIQTSDIAPKLPTELPILDNLLNKNAVTLDCLVEKEISRTQTVSSNEASLQHVTLQSVKKLQYHSKSDDVSTPESKSMMVVTPMADYSIMKTKELKKELNKYGLKPGMDRNKAKKLLKYIYNQLHPHENDVPHQPAVELANLSASTANNLKSEEPNKKKETLEKEEDSCHECSTLSSGVEYSDDSFYKEDEIVPKENVESDHQSSYVGLKAGFQNLIQCDPNLHQRILLYQPVWLKPLKSSLKETKVNCSTRELADYFDEKCITFRTQQRRNKCRKQVKAKT